MDTYIVRRHLKIYATKVFTRFLRSALRFCLDLFLRSSGVLGIEDRFLSLTYRLYFPGGRLMTRPVTNKPRLLAPHRLVSPSTTGPLFFVVRIIAYQRNWASIPIAVLHDSASPDYISSLRIVSPDRVPPRSRTHHSSASLR